MAPEVEGRISLSINLLPNAKQMVRVSQFQCLWASASSLELAISVALHFQELNFCSTTLNLSSATLCSTTLNLSRTQFL